MDVLLFLTHFWSHGCFSSPIIHSRWDLSGSWSFLCVFIHIFGCFSHFPYGWEVFFVILSGWVVSLTNCCHLPHFLPENSFFCCWVNDHQGFTILGFIAVIFAHAMPIIIAKFEFLTQGSISPFTNMFLVEKRFYSNPDLALCCVCILCFFLNWFGVELGKN